MLSQVQILPGAFIKMAEKTITQEDITGCGVACTAFILKLSYKKAKNLFNSPKGAYSRGYYCREIVQTLKNCGLNYSHKKLNQKNKRLLNKRG